MANIVIVGAGFGGLTAACRLAQTVKGRHTITLIDRKDSCSMGLTKLWVLLGLRKPGEGTVAIKAIEKKGVKFVQAEVERIDTAKKTITIKRHPLPQPSSREREEGAIAYDQLILAMGAETAPEAVPGLSASDNLYDPDNGAELHRRLASLAAGRIAVVICASPYKCPPAPFECALLLESRLREKGLAGRVSVGVFVPEARPMMVAGKQAGEAVLAMLAARGVAARTEHKLKRVDGRKLFFENGAEAEADLLLAIPPHRAPAAVRESGLCDASGWIPVDPKTGATRLPEVHAVGDVTAVPLPGGGMLPKAGVFAEAEAEVVADRVAAALESGRSLRDFDGKAVCWMEAGDGKAIEIQADFFGDPMKRAAMAEPSAQSLEKKKEFERSRLEAWFG